MRYLSGLILLSLLAWGVSLPADAWSQGFFFWRAQGIQLTGLLAVACTVSGLSFVEEKCPVL